MPENEGPEWERHLTAADDLLRTVSRHMGLLKDGPEVIDLTIKLATAQAILAIAGQLRVTNLLLEQLKDQIAMTRRALSSDR